MSKEHDTAKASDDVIPRGASTTGKQAELQGACEKWRTVPGFPDYQVSSLGRVMSLRRGKPRVLKPTACRDGHLQVELFSDSERWKVRVGAVVLLAFIGPCAPGSVVKHRDGDKRNNAVANLVRMPTASAIRRDFSTGRHPTKLNTESVAAIRVGGCLAHLRPKAAANLFGVAQATIYKVRKGLSWAWVPGAASRQASSEITDSRNQSHGTVTVSV